MVRKANPPGLSGGFILATTVNAGYPAFFTAPKIKP
jgi:hypothetical protein